MEGGCPDSAWRNKKRTTDQACALLIQAGTTGVLQFSCTIKS
jgi:hypothetical protein